VSEPQIIARARLAAFDDRPGRPTAKDKRAALFRETPYEVCVRTLLGTAWVAKPERAHTLIPLARLWLADVLGRSGALPASDTPAYGELAGIARDLSVPTLMEGYRRGLFPHGHVGPAKWLSPAMRGVLELNAFRISTRLRSMMRQGRYRITFDEDFENVIAACAGRRPGQWRLTWITPRIMHAYAKLHDAGHAHSFEVWNDRGELAGGGYGVAVGRTFVIESQFFRESNASKIGFSVLAWHLAEWGFALADNKWLTPTTAQMGFCEIPRADYLRRLSALSDDQVRAGPWAAEADSKTVADWRPAPASASKPG
jgi:leucyl/phenylalanyl-tRNA---protein transferase